MTNNRRRTRRRQQQQRPSSLSFSTSQRAFSSTSFGSIISDFASSLSDDDDDDDDDEHQFLPVDERILPRSASRRQSPYLEQLTVNKIRFQRDQQLYGRSRETKALLQAAGLAVVGHDTATPSSSSSTPDPGGPPVRVILIRGVSGVGKTSVACSLEQPVVDQGGIFVSGKYAVTGGSSSWSVDTSSNSNSNNNKSDGATTNAGNSSIITTDVPYAAVTAACKQLCDFKYISSESIQELREHMTDEAIESLATWLPRIKTIVGMNGDQNGEHQQGGRGKATQDTVVDASEAGKNRFRYALTRFVEFVAGRGRGTLVMMLDDLQNADADSFHMLETLLHDLGGTKRTSFVLVGCYRSNEVDDAHILSQWKRSLKSISTAVTLTEMPINELDLSSVNEMISDVLNKEKCDTERLAAVLHKKTMGNPFFVKEFLKSLTEKGLLEFNLALMEWCWDDDQVESKTEVTENVIDFVKSRMESLPAEIFRVLPLAACLGTTFTERLLTIVMERWNRTVALDGPETSARSEEKQLGTVRWLESCIEEGFIEECDRAKQSYRWMHDKIQEAALDLIAAENRQRLRGKLGVLLFYNLSHEENMEKVFVVVNLVNENERIAAFCDEDRVEISKLNLEAGERAISCASFDQAAIYLRKGIDWLPELHWSKHYDLSLQLFSTAAEAEYVNGDIENLERHCRIVFEQKGRPVEDMFRCYVALCNSKGNRGELDEAINIILSVLEKLGSPLPARFRLFHTVREIFRLKGDMKKHTTDAMMLLPAMGDENKTMVMHLLDRLVMFAYMSESNVLALAIFKSFRLTLACGISRFAPMALCNVALIACGALGDIQASRMYCEHALLLLDRLKFPEPARARTYLMAYGLAIHYTLPLQVCKPHLLRGFQSGMATGDIEGAFYCIFFFMFAAFFTGRQLEGIKEDLSVYTIQMKAFQQTHAHAAACMHHQIVLNLMGLSDEPAVVKGDAFGLDEDDVKKLGGHMELVFGMMEMLNFFYLCEDELGAERALRLEKDHPKTDESAFTFAFMEATRATLCYGAARKTNDRGGCLKLARKSHGTIKRWIKQGSPNFTHLDGLLDAEKAALGCKNELAKRHYERAVLAAGRQGYIHDQGLINERYGDFLKECGDVSDADYRWLSAIELYQEWGAAAKVVQVQRKLDGTNRAG